VTDITTFAIFLGYYIIMNIATYAGKQFAELSPDEQSFYDLPNALPLGWFVLITAVSDVRQERHRQQDDLIRVGSSAPEVKGGLSRYLMDMEGLSGWAIDVSVEAQLWRAGIDPNPDLHAIGADGL
jgi:hypothetical protein